ncbi:MAG: T9SS type A sorting domain-containing protein [Bacteroidia bacterium]
MKTKRILLIALVLAGIFSKKGFAQQAQLQIYAVDSFPTWPNDTVYENQTRNLGFRVRNVNSSPLTVNAYLKIFLLNTDTTLLSQPLQLVDTSYFIQNLVGNDTIYVLVSNYPFTSATYRAGNNIVVVWPRIGNDPTTTYDSLQLDTVYFVPFSSINMLRVDNEAFSVFPNPVKDKINMNSGDRNPIEYVRILDDMGQQMLYRRTSEKQLDVHFLSDGFYFVEIKARNGIILRRKFLKL